MTALFRAFQDTAAPHAGRPALVCAQKTWSYADLLQAVHAAAAVLRSVGASREAVALHLPKSANLIVWQLAANSADVVFALIDPALPCARQEVMADKLQPRLQVTLPHAAPAGKGWALSQQLDGVWLWRRDQAHRYPEPVSHIYFSSGSTGEPKAILLPAAPVVSVVRQQACRLGITEQSRFGWLLQAGFDASLSDCYQALLSGAALHISEVPLTQRRGVQRFLCEHAITHTDLPPSVLALLSPEDLPSLQAVIFGGELAREAVVQAWRAAGKRMFNAYGPTEATICSSLQEVNATWTNSNIGQALAGVRYALQTPEGLMPAQPGLSGELVILGEHLAQGYDLPSMTAKRFKDEGLGRGYWTGDAVTVDKHGDLHFQGRIDRQLKRNGVLVCPEEIERAALAAGCAEARVQLENDRLVLHYSAAAAEADIQAGVQQTLPRAFWPQSWTRWNRLPKNNNGKVAYDPSTV